MDNTPIIPYRNFAEPRVFVTKWQPEIDKKVKRKKAFSKDRDTKYFDDSHNLNQWYMVKYGKFTSVYFDLID
jgi:hypothetical protein